MRCDVCFANQVGEMWRGLEAEEKAKYEALQARPAPRTVLHDAPPCF